MKSPMVFFREWLPLDKAEFRILAMNADKGEFRGTLSDMLRYFRLSEQTNHRNRLKASIEQLQKRGFITVNKSGNTYTLKAIPQATKIEIPRRWAEPIIQHEYSSESVSWEAVLKVFIWIYENKKMIVVDQEIADELNISTSTIGSAKNVLEREHHSIIREVIKIELHDGDKRNKGQDLRGIAEWSDTR